MLKSTSAFNPPPVEVLDPEDVVGAVCVGVADLVVMVCGVGVGAEVGVGVGVSMTGFSVIETFET